MPENAPNPEQANVFSILDRTPVDNTVKTSVWNAYFSSQTEDDLKRNLDPVLVPNDIKTALWNEWHTQRYKPEAPAAAAPQPSTNERLNWAGEQMGKEIGKEAISQMLNLGGMVRNTPVIGPAISAISPDPLANVNRAVTRARVYRDPVTGEFLETDEATAGRMGMQPVTTEPVQEPTPPYSMFNREGQAAIGLAPENTPQKVTQGLMQAGEYFLPTRRIQQAQAALKALPVVGRLGQAGQWAAEAIPEVGSAVGVTKVQGQGGEGTVGLLAAASPIYGRAIDWTGKRLPTAVAEKIPEVQLSPRQMMWKALKPNVRNREFDRALDLAMPELYETARNAGIKIERGAAGNESSVDALLKVIKLAKQRVWKPYADFLGETKATISGDAIAAARRANMPARIAAQDEEALKAIEAVNEKFYNGRRLTLQEAEDALQSVNALTDSYYQLYPRARYAKQETNPVVRSYLQEAQALRAAIKEKVDMIGRVQEALGGPGAAKLTAKELQRIKDTYGALSNLEAEAYRRVNVSKRLAPESLAEQLAMIKAAGHFAKGVFMGRPGESAMALLEGLATRQAGKIIKERNTTDYLLEKAFSLYGKEVEKFRRGQRVFIGAPAWLNSGYGGNP